MPTNTRNTRIPEDKTPFFLLTISMFFSFYVLQTVHLRYDSIKKYSYMKVLIPRCLAYIIYTSKRKEVMDSMYFGEVGNAFDSKICNGERAHCTYRMPRVDTCCGNLCGGSFPVTLVTGSLFLLPHRIYSFIAFAIPCVY